MSIATFADANLDECIDFAFDLPPGKDGEATTKGLVEGLGKNAKRLPGTCDDAFKDRLIMASCSAAVDLAKGKLGALKADALDCKPSPGKGCELDLTAAPKAAMLHVTEHHYLFEKALGGDAMLQSCLEMNGKWEALSRDSEEYKRAKREAQVKKLDDLTKKFGGPE